MNSCPKCTTLLESWEISCHSCGVAILSEIPPQVSDIAPARGELEEAYKSWLDKGKQALTSGEYEEACNCLREAVKRSRPLDDAGLKEVAARQALAEGLERLNKIQEAADQYRIIAQEQPTEDMKELWLKKSQDLVASASTLPYDLLFQKEEFRVLREDEVRVVPLYCVGCKRLLAEAEVYGFRRGAMPSVRCWCGTDGRPLAKQDAKHSRALQEAQTAAPTGQRAKAIAVASKELAGGKSKSKAACLALFTGFVGGHKFYLGETTAGFIYLLWFWTLIPFLISLYEAIVLFEMSVTTFNMTYNIELVLALVEPPDEKAPKMDVFSMEISDDNPTVEAGQSDC